MYFLHRKLSYWLPSFPPHLLHLRLRCQFLTRKELQVLNLFNESLCRERESDGDKKISRQKSTLQGQALKGKCLLQLGQNSTSIYTHGYLLTKPSKRGWLCFLKQKFGHTSCRIDVWFWVWVSIIEDDAANKTSLLACHLWAKQKENVNFLKWRDCKAHSWNFKKKDWKPRQNKNNPDKNNKLRVSIYIPMPILHCNVGTFAETAGSLIEIAKAAK